MKTEYRKLGEYIRLVDVRNTDLKVNHLLGVSVEKCFIESIANTIGTDFSKYKIVKKRQFTYIPDTSRRGDKIGIALLTDYDEGLVSNIYTVFEVIDTSKLLPEYLMLWFSRPEFDRYARYKSHGSVREIFDWEEMCRVELPVPAIEKQQKIVDAYNAISKRIQIKQKINENLEKTAQCLFEKYVVSNTEFEFSEALDDNIEYTNGLPLQEYRPESNELYYPVLKIRELTQGYCDNNSELCSQKIPKYAIITKGDLIFSWSGTLQVNFWYDVDAGLNQHLFKVSSTKYPLWFCYLWTKYYLLSFQRIAKNKGTTFGHIKREDLHNSKIKVIDFTKYSNMFSVIIEQKYQNGVEIRKLQNLKQLIISRISGV